MCAAKLLTSNLELYQEIEYTLFIFTMRHICKQTPCPAHATILAAKGYHLQYYLRSALYSTTVWRALNGNNFVLQGELEQ